VGDENTLILPCLSPRPALAINDPSSAPLIEWLDKIPFSADTSGCKCLSMIGSISDRAMRVVMPSSQIRNFSISDWFAKI
jgi:hypothetical protein